MITVFLEEFGRDFSQFFINGFDNFFASTLLLVIGIVLLGALRSLIFGR